MTWSHFARGIARGFFPVFLAGLALLAVASFFADLARRTSLPLSDPTPRPVAELPR